MFAPPSLAVWFSAFVWRYSTPKRQKYHFWTWERANPHKTRTEYRNGRQTHPERREQRKTEEKHQEPERERCSRQACRAAFVCVNLSKVVGGLFLPLFRNAMQRYCFFRTYASARKKKTQKTQKNCILYDFSLSGLPICEKIADIAIFRQIGFDVLTNAPEFDLIFAWYTEYRVINIGITIFFQNRFS